MALFRRHKTHHTWPYLLFGVVLFVFIFRALLPSLMESFANNRLKKESPYFSFHINDIDLHILRGQYVVKGITGTIKENKEQFLKIDSVVSDLPWRNIFKGKPLANVTVNKMDLSASQLLLDNAKKEGQRMKEKAAKADKKDEKKESPVNINSFALRDSKILIHDFMSFKGNETRSVEDINMFAKNLTPTVKKPYTNFVMSATVFGPAPLNVVGVAQTQAEPLKWDMNATLKNFDMTTVNPFIKEKVQAFIRKGKLDMYTEIKSEGEKIEGYLKPFVSKMKMDTPPGGFKFKGAAAATGGNLVKILLTDSEAKTLATEVPFTFEKEKLDLEVLPVLQKAVVHKAKQNIQPGIEDKVGQKGLGLKETKQAQEAKP